MNKIKPIVLLIPFLLTSCGSGVTPISKEEAFKTLDNIRKYYESDDVITPEKLVTKKHQRSWSELFKTYGTYDALYIYDSSREDEVLGYSKESYINIGEYRNATIERWYLLSNDETKAGVISKSEVKDEAYERKFDLNVFAERNEFTILVNSGLLSGLHYSYSIANIYADDLMINILNNEYDFSTNGDNFIMDVSNSKNGLVELSYLIFEGNLVTLDEYKNKIGDTVRKEYKTTYTLEQKDIPSCPNNNLLQ